jgi:hypothetical protein
LPPPKTWGPASPFVGLPTTSRHAHANWNMTGWQISDHLPGPVIYRAQHGTANHRCPWQIIDQAEAT